ncbi:hypothetical protein P4H67_24875 [Paenibacillus lautus]|uniref:hypothetical protein n=1 Tax=Paenibacillus lautus TaxID=1401 RepID=UPI002DBB770C|nr:hypothetical protein [Paenibacillus lautus]MEC0309990.1 hypothetical protein [Paenibacillus lautus]
MSKFEMGVLTCLKTLKVELFSDSHLDDLQDQVNEFQYHIHPDDVKDKPHRCVTTVINGVLTTFYVPLMKL